MKLPQSSSLTRAVRGNDSAITVWREGTVLWTLRFEDVRTVAVWKFDAFSYDIICIGFCPKTEECFFEADEEHDGFTELLDILPIHFPGIRTDWWGGVAFPAFAENFAVIWPIAELAFTKFSVILLGFHDERNSLFPFVVTLLTLFTARFTSRFWGGFRECFPPVERCPSGLRNTPGKTLLANASPTCTACKPPHNHPTRPSHSSLAGRSGNAVRFGAVSSLRSVVLRKRSDRLTPPGTAPRPLNATEKPVH